MTSNDPRPKSLFHAGIGAAALVAGLYAAEARAQADTTPCVQNSGNATILCGTNASAAPSGAAYGYFAHAIGSNGTALGASATTYGQGDIAIGDAVAGSSGGTSTNGNIAIGTDSDTADGFDDQIAPTASGGDSIAIGTASTVGGQFGTATGAYSTVNEAHGTAYGATSNSSGTGASVFGYHSTANSDGGVAIGAESIADASGYFFNGDAVGDLAGPTAVGSESRASGQNGTALGSFAIVGNVRNSGQINNGTALGAQANVGGSGAGFGNVALGAFSYDGSDYSRNVVSVGSDGSNGLTAFTRAITNVSNGVVSATSTDAVTGQQLYAAEQTISTGGGAGGTPYLVVNSTSALPTAAGPGAIALGGATSTGGSGSVAIGEGATASANNAVALGAGSAAARDDAVSVGAVGAERQIVNVAAGVVATGSTDAVNGGQLATTNQSVATAQATASAAQASANSAQTSANRANAGTAALATSLGGGASYDATSGAYTGPTYHVANGTQTNVGQALDALDASLGHVGTAANAVLYNDSAHSAITLGGAGSTTPVALGNVAAGTVSANSHDAVDGAQLDATNRNVTTAQSTADTALGAATAAQGTAKTALVLGQNSVQYDDAQHDSVSLGSGGGTAGLHDVAPAVSGTDAVNLNQLNAGMAADHSYTDREIAAVRFDLSRARRDAASGIAGANALAGIPQAFEPGMGMIGGAFGSHAGYAAVALGMSKAFNDGHTVVKAAVSFETRTSSVDTHVGFGYGF